MNSLSSPVSVQNTLPPEIQHMHDALKAQKTAYLQNTVPSAHERIERIARLRRTLVKYQDEFALNYVNQPPLIPHSVAGMQVTKNVNQCLACHSPENSRVTGAPRISPTHFINRDGVLQANLAARRYFCLQCHIPQTNAKPIVQNDFKPVTGYGSK